jgi:predicted metallopeptidase
MNYEYAEDLQKLAEEISLMLFPHIDMSRVKCFRSYGSSSRRTIARCHALGKIMQLAVGVKAHYALEFISKRYDKLSQEEKIKTIIHELMHIPKTFGGGFRHHDWVCDENVNLFHKTYTDKKNQIEKYERKNIEVKNEKVGIKGWF